MLSLAKTTSEAELRDWERRVHDLTGVTKVDYVCELKLDGMSMALRFESGTLALGITRGNGTSGEDVTANVRTIRSIPLNISAQRLKEAGLPKAFEVRGELLMPHRVLRPHERRPEAEGPCRGSPIRVMPPPGPCGNLIHESPRSAAWTSLPMVCWPTVTPFSNGIRKR